MWHPKPGSIEDIEDFLARVPRYIATAEAEGFPERAEKWKALQASESSKLAALKKYRTHKPCGYCNGTGFIE